MSTSPKGPTRQWRKLKEPVLDDEIRASVALGAELIHPEGQHDLDRQSYATLIHDGIPNQSEAQEVIRALHRAGKRLGYSVAATAESLPLGAWQVRFRAICKECARAYIQVKYPDRSMRPYDPMRKRNANDYK